ncbi:MAG: xanthine dehydrogenase molybdopterin binding subunit [Oceanospirillaceae bacterium]|uniref:xanthine dehydrogenase molybdopterin binding subunit n=3 Tax=unclassified Thalassolituus TaxID=2624967 RepID=UPI000C633B50|nr:xanthine dehydrogenase molybdopterin binding subunit [Thalassolituus sp. UBA6592]MAS25997.1 xanthine dehydrogenase molybdopterin binding subunit [Oceanospirillaceae bacterium]MAX99940.1 xanthine dehydrogenase molybdopterin binding subunit [Oceanospirillaceae bacterium]MBL35340.1 xanthine dehydrogenase molybdopterin binding subunit [Oceanospirillaceae bacterium]|tara:strand:+ start:1333 stop:3687 length:2355 start_codon:yes stop_codon:yes gene_type:complete
MSFTSSKVTPWEQRRQRPPKGKSGKELAHESAEKHVLGTAVYIDDVPEIAGTLHAVAGKSTINCGLITKLDLSGVWASPGVVDVITVDDVPGDIDISPAFTGDLILANGRVDFYGQAIFAVVAETFDQAKRAVNAAVVEYQQEEPILSVKEALKRDSFVNPTHTMVEGDVENALSAAANTLSGEMYVRGQEQFYLETQISYAIPGEDGSMKVLCSTQHPSEVQKLVAEVLDVPINHVQAEVRRMGGGFGGKETQAAQWACLAAVFATRLNRPVKMRLDRQDDMVLTGKRHDFLNRFKIGFDDEGRIQGADIELASFCGYSADLSDSITDRAMFHVDNAYNLHDCRVIGHRCRTNTVSNTAFRGFGGPQGMILAECMLDDIARKVGKDPLDVRKLNYYKEGEQTHYGQPIEDFYLPELIETLENNCDYRKRREDIAAFNKTSPWKKRGLALTPVRFGISFTTTFLNQAGALVHIYTDGSIHLNHGGTEMGQGLYTKVAQVVANEFAVDVDMVRVSATTTDKVPNTSATAASSGTDLNGKAAQNACITLKKRLVDFAVDYFKVAGDAVRFENNHIVVTGDDGQEDWVSFAEFVNLAYVNRVSLSTTGFYKTPEIHYDPKAERGKPFLYYAFGATCAEVEIDTLTGEYKILRADILHDVGNSLNPAIDIGQVEGAFVQGTGWLTSEELLWDNQGRLSSASAATYKIPTSVDIPEVFNVELFDRPAAADTIYHSKAVGEPPLMHGIAVFCALRDAVASVSDYKVSPQLDTPATPERILNAVMACQAAE